MFWGLVEGREGKGCRLGAGGFWGVGWWRSMERLYNEALWEVKVRERGKFGGGGR